MSGLFDYGPAGTALQNNLVDTWRKHFVLEEDMLEGKARASSQTAKMLTRASGLQHIDASRSLEDIRPRG